MWKNLISRVVNALKNCKRSVMPVTSTVTEVVQKGYNVSRQVDGAVRTQARVIHKYFYDDQIRDLLSRNLKFVFQNSALYVVRCYGGGPIIDIVSASLQDKNAAFQRERLEELEKKVAKLEKALCSRKIRVKAGIYLAFANSNDKLRLRKQVNLNLEDLLRIFLMKHLGVKVLDDLVIVNAGSRMSLNPVSALDSQYDKNSRRCGK